MLQKESVISWFKSLSGNDRVDLLCNLLNCSLPWEIRFYSTFLEAQVQRDYPVFRQAESTANNPTDLSGLFCLEDAHIRRKLCVCLALLHSSNRQAAAVLFGILNDYQPSTLVEEEFFSELFLLMTMSAHHPAFSFHQKHIMRARLRQLKNSQNRTSDLSETVSESSSGSSAFSSDQDVTLLPDDLHEERHCANATDNRETEQKVPNDEHLYLPKVRDQAPEVYVEEFKVKSIERIKDRKSRHDLRKRDVHRYVLQVLWCDETTETIHRTYEEMFDFQCKLRKMFPNKLDASGNHWKLPFLPGRIRIFNKPDPKGEKTPIPDITDYARLFSSLPKFVRGCDHVVKFFQSNNRTRKKSETKKSKGLSKKEDQPGKVKCKDFETPHRIAEAVREQSLAGKGNIKKKTVDTTNARKQLPNNMFEDHLIESNEPSTGVEPSVVNIDENGNEVKASPPGLSVKPDKNGPYPVADGQSKNISQSGALLSTSRASAPLKPALSSELSDKTLHKLGSNGLLSLHVTLPSSPVTSYPSPSQSSSGSPVTSPIGSPSFSQRPCTSNVKWGFRPHGCAMTVCDWLRRLRLHKYSELFKGKTFDQMLKLSDEDLENLGLTTGARRKLRVNLEILRTSGCFTSNGLTIVDRVVPPPPADLTSLPVHSGGIFMSPGHSPLCCSADSEFPRSESDSASDCGSDLLSEPGCSQFGFSSSLYSTKIPVFSSWRVSCYNCGSLGHVGGQCMAPNVDKRTIHVYHCKEDGQFES